MPKFIQTVSETDIQVCGTLNHYRALPAKSQICTLDRTSPLIVIIVCLVLLANYLHLYIFFYPPPPKYRQLESKVSLS